MSAETVSLQLIWNAMRWASDPLENPEKFLHSLPAGGRASVAGGLSMLTNRPRLQKTQEVDRCRNYCLRRS